MCCQPYAFETYFLAIKETCIEFVEGVDLILGAGLCNDMASLCCNLMILSIPQCIVVHLSH